jgi:cytochrome c oxidase subunit 2
MLTDDEMRLGEPRASGRRGRSLRRLVAASGLTLAMAVAAVACGDDGDGASSSQATPGTPAERGEQLARSKGCAGCHGQDFGGGAGPEWVGLAGSEVTLTDGSTVVADEAYLVRAIANPGAELVDGYNLKMPANNLSDAEIDDIVAFIQSLADG